ncbi:hypothetical protein ACQJBY_058277 [Aegilops geniculata]
MVYVISCLAGSLCVSFEKLQQMNIIFIQISSDITDIPAARGSRCLRPELGLLAGDLAITSLYICSFAGMDIWIEWYPPEIYTDVRSEKEEIGQRKLDRRKKR